MNNSGRTAWVDYSKGIGIILVVYGHVVGGAMPESMKIPRLMLLSRDIIYHFHMPLFFFLSGLFVQTSLSKRGTRRFIVNKSAVLGYPYFVWSVLQGSAVMLMSSYTSLSANLTDLLALWYRPLYHFWFLYALFLMYAAFALIKNITVFSLPVLIGFACLLFFFPFSTPLAGLDYFSANLIYFVFGILYHHYSLDAAINGKVSIAYVGLTIGFLIVSEIVLASTGTSKAVLLAVSCSGIMAVGIISKYLAASGRLSVLKSLGFYSMPVYLTHGFSGSGSRIALCTLFKFENGTAVIPVATVLGVVLPVLAYRLAGKYFPYLFELPMANNRLQHE